MITLVYPSNINPIWEEIKNLLMPVLELSGTHEIEDIRKILIGGQAQLWIQWNDGVEIAVVTEFKNYPKGMAFNLWLAGAKKDIKAEWKEFLDVLTNFAKKNGCRWIEDCGRIGWEKYAPSAKKIAILRRIEI